MNTEFKVEKSPAFRVGLVTKREVPATWRVMIRGEFRPFLGQEEPDEGWTYLARGLKNRDEALRFVAQYANGMTSDDYTD